MRKLPFWWVVKARCRWWVPPFRDWCYMARSPGYSGGGPKQSDGTVHLSHAKAKKFATRLREEGAEVKVVRVWARLPRPKLPDWLVPFDRPGSMSIFRQSTTSPGRWDEWVFRQFGPPAFLELVTLRMHYGPGSCQHGQFDMARVDVFEEAVLRAAALRRAGNRAHKEE